MAISLLRGACSPAAGAEEGSAPDHTVRSLLQDTLLVLPAVQHANSLDNFIRVIKRVSVKRSPGNFLNRLNAKQKLPTNCKFGKQ